jgi:uncharacterized protein (DUF2141 family)
MRIFFFSLLFLAFSYTGLTQDLNLKIIVEGIEEQEGTIYLSLHDNEDSFPSADQDAVRTGKIESFGKTAEYTFENLSEGTYAISVFQDMNGNAEMDTNFLGIPKEPVGASNQNSFGRPKFSKSKFTLSKNTTIRVGYMN